jgi:hypothetical protein
MSVVKQLYFQIFEENNYMFRPFSGWAIIRLRLEYRRKFIYYNVDIKCGRPGGSEARNIVTRRIYHRFHIKG